MRQSIADAWSEQHGASTIPSMAYLHAHNFLTELKKQRKYLTVKQCHDLREQALNGEVDEAMKRLGRMLLGREE